MSAGRVDVIIVSYNTRDDLAACLSSLMASASTAIASVHVVDNGSSDGSPAYVAATWPDVVLTRLTDNVGFGAANNIAIRTSTAPLVLFLNSDTIVPPGAIETLVERLTATDAVAAGPKLVDGHGRPEVSFGPMLSPVAEWRQRQLVRKAASERPDDRAAIAALVNQERVVDWVSGACLLARRDAVVAAGLFDERYFMYEEDVDLCAALRQAGGHILFTPRSEVRHLRGRSVSGAGPSASRHYDRSHVRFYEKHHPALAPWLKLWLLVRGRSSR